MTNAIARLFVPTLCLTLLSLSGNTITKAHATEANANANRLLVEAVGPVQQAKSHWASRPWTEGVALKEFLTVATLVPGSYDRLIAARSLSQIADMNLAFETVAGLLRQVVDTLKSIPEHYPSSNVAVALATGQAIGDLSMPELEDQVSQLQHLLGTSHPTTGQSVPDAEGTPKSTRPLPDPDSVEACVEDPDFTKPACLAVLVYEVHRVLKRDIEIAMALANIAAAQRAAGDEIGFDHNFETAHTIFQRELADTRQNQHHVQEIFLLAVMADAYGLSGHDPQEYAQAINDLLQAVRGGPSPSEHDEAVINAIHLFTSWGLFAEEVINLADHMHDPTLQAETLNMITIQHTANGNLRPALATAEKALAYAEQNAESIDSKTLLAAAVMAYALSGQITPEAEEASTTLPSLELHNTALYLLTTTHAGTGNIEPANASLARIPTNRTGFKYSPSSQKRKPEPAITRKPAQPPSRATSATERSRHLPTSR